jgi:Peptidase family M1 domain
MPRLLLAAALLLTPLALHAQPISATNSPNGAPLSTRVVAYTIDAKLDTDKKSLDATETLIYKNLTGQPLTTFPFHLYLNAFRPESTFTTETRFNGGIRDSFGDDYYPKEKLGSITISHIEADTYGDLTPSLHFIAPDDGNLLDHTVAEITLPRPLAPNDSVTFRLTFHDQFPLSVARNGYKRDFIMGGQWFPKPGVFWHGAWNCHQYHSTTEFFSDFGTYNVHLTVPNRYMVGASGVPTGETGNPDNTKTIGFYGEDIHDFAFAASPNFVITNGTYLSALGPVQVHVLALAAHPNIGRRYLDITLKTLRKFEDWYGPYPYKIITVVDPEPGSEMQGMEYPTLFTGDGSWWGPFSVVEITTEHEFGHQYWYGMVATNEFQEAWLDEGINSYTEVKVLAAILGRDTSALNRPWANLSDRDYQRLGYLGIPDFDPITRFAWLFRNDNSYGSITYGKSATALATLEGLIGRDTMDEAMRTWFQRYRFTHPTTEDFLRTIEEIAIKNGKALPGTPTNSHNKAAPNTQNGTPNGAPAPNGNGGIRPEEASPFTNGVGTMADDGTIIQSGGTHSAASGTTEPTLSLPKGPAASFPQPQPFPTTPPLTTTGFPDYATAHVINSTLRPFFNQAIYGTQVLDYAIDNVSTDPVQWWLPPPKDPTQIVYRNAVHLHRKGDFILPVTVEIVFTDGTRLREHWDGIDRWTAFIYNRNAKIQSAEIDPDHTILLDANFFNNSYTTTPNRLPARKLTNLWLTVQQLAAQLTAWLI